MTRMRAENGRLPEANERLQMLLAAKDAKIPDPEEPIARLERLISRNSLRELIDAAEHR
jgi:hypothetical protein